MCGTSVIRVSDTATRRTSKCLCFIDGYPIFSNLDLIFFLGTSSMYNSNFVFDCVCHLIYRYFIGRKFGSVTTVRDPLNEKISLV